MHPFRLSPEFILIVLSVILASVPGAYAEEGTLLPNRELGPIGGSLGEGNTQLRVRTRPEIKLPGSPETHVWKDYDIRPFTRQAVEQADPQQAVLDWILRQTGTDTWFRSPGGLLNADRHWVHVYHSEQTHAQVAQLLQRFLHARNTEQSISVKLVTVDNPQWRKFALRTLTPIQVHSPGMDAWTLAKEDATILLATLRQQVGFQEHAAPNTMVANGQSQVLQRMQPRTYRRSVLFEPNTWPMAQTVPGDIDEGFSLQISSLADDDRQICEVALHCKVNHLESLETVDLSTPPSLNRLEIDIPQLSSWEIRERFRWPQDRVLLICRNVAAMPGTTRPDLLSGVFGKGERRLDALLFLQSNPSNQRELATKRQEFRTGQLDVRDRY